MGDDFNQENTPDVQPGPDRLLTLSGLAEWLMVSEAEARTTVRRCGVPFIRVTGADDRINWKKIRFSLNAVRKWVQDSQEKYRPREDKTFVAVPKTKRLGNWRKPATTG